MAIDKEPHMAKEKELLETARAMKDWLVQTRRLLHRIPEAGDAEFETQAAICAALDSLGVPYEKKTHICCRAHRRSNPWQGGWRESRHGRLAGE